MTSKSSMYLTSINRPFVWHILLLDYGMLNWPKNTMQDFHKRSFRKCWLHVMYKESSLFIDILMARLWLSVVVSPMRPSFEICMCVWCLCFTCLDPCHPGTLYPCIWINIPAIICASRLVAPVHMSLYPWSCQLPTLMQSYVHVHVDMPSVHVCKLPIP